MINNEQVLAAAFARYRNLALTECFDAANLESRPTPKQWEILKDIGKVQFRYVVAGNQSGKSSTPAREIAWILTDTHPFWERPTEWLTEPLLIIIAGQDRKMMEIELWSKKILPFLNADDWKPVRVGGSLQYAENRKTGDRIVFLSHNDSSEKNRVHMQGYVAHYLWLDEMPSSIKILEELQRRVDARKGYLIATFTPKFRNEEIRAIIENSRLPLAKTYRLSKLDNPLYADRVEEELQKLEGYPESYRNAILYGDWYTGDSAVYYFNRDTMIEDPPNYHPGWRHVEASDPALQSKFGFTLWAECPSNGVWYMVKDDYIENILTPEEIFAEVLKKTRGYNMVRRIGDPHEAWYLNTASSKGYPYMTPFNKNSRKGELIKNLQQALGNSIKISSWCTNFLSEIQSCQWSETGSGRIVNASSYHLLDSAQYFVDCKPTSEYPIEIKPWHQELRERNQKRKELKKLTDKLKVGKRRKWLMGRRLV